ncbi:hypothetical protein SAMN05216178_2203 [Pseudomonas saponiphila]|uniref:CAAX prenyl protease 2/Lysostaphin resistance protein A-like domain-containing protein n=1 Tax=Pseudomonas saponiphila TaxID=556534 RepID=A0A1H4M309_9PSED|nr:type II CAAX endopeptidase family protein [Pseudomonas saponiphila]SEB77343.1 hypothetical protein SAMN05216178_2203 [Pseudomonas saponiphila]
MTHLFSPPGVCAPERSTYRFFPRVGLFILATLLYILSGVPGILLMPTVMQSYLVFVIISGAAALSLSILFAIQYRSGLAAQLRGRTFIQPLKMGALSLIALYALCGVIIMFISLPQEAFMNELLTGLDTRQTLIKVASLIVLPPILEELYFRHYLLRLFPYESSQLWKWIAVIATSAIFAGVHTQYDNWTSIALLFACGCVLAIARIASGAVSVPILLHMLLEVIALSADWAFKLAELYG